MIFNKTFTIQEAKDLLPQVRQMLVDANLELQEIAERLKVVHEAFQDAENDLGTVKTGKEDVGDLTRLRECRAAFQEQTQKLSAVQKEYEDCLHKWFHKITDLGIILRDIPTGLLDFPAQKGDTDYLLCWRLDDKDLDYWHLPNDGFIGRRPLAVLDEYF
ncbi:hypothetical protein BH10CYA1_BH10CYA1_42640 [soil metagenome]